MQKERRLIKFRPYTSLLVLIFYIYYKTVLIYEANYIL